jgi:Domain of unknown function (DUF4157)
MLASHTIQAKLVIAPSGDRYESEADRVADTVLRSPAGVAPRALGISRVSAPPVQRKCAQCEEERIQRKAVGDPLYLQRKCAGCEEEEMQRKASGGAGAGDVRPSVESSRANDLADAVGAHAFTTRQDIFFAAGKYQPASPEGRRLLVHELTHTVQQGGAPSVLQREEAKEAADEDVALDWKDQIIIEGFAGPAAALGGTVHAMVKATATGFVKQVKTDAKAKGGPFWDKVKESFSLRGAASFILHYWWGLVKGIFSPITGLIDLAKLAIKLQEMQAQILATAWAHRGELAAEAGQIGTGMSALAGRVGEFLSGLSKEPINTVKALGKWFSSLGEGALKAAESGGRTAGKTLMSQLDKPLGELGEIAGEIVGTILINIVLLVFTTGLGNAISQIATRLGEFASFLGKFGKAAELIAVAATKLGELLGTVGGWITKAEVEIAKVAETVLKPMAPILEEFGKLVSGLRAFLRKLLGLSEEAVAGATEQAAGGVARTLEGHEPPVTTPKPVAKPAAPPKAVVKPAVKTLPPAGATDEGAAVAGSKVTPHTDPVPAAHPKPAASAPEEKLFRGISGETEALLERRPGLRKILSEHPDAADLFKLCKSECFPSFMSDEEIAERLVRLEKIEAEAKRLGTPLDRAATKEILHAQKNVEQVDRALADLETRIRKPVAPGADPGIGEQAPPNLKTEQPPAKTGETSPKTASGEAIPRRPAPVKGTPTRPSGPKPGINEPNAAEWRYQEYAYKQSLEGKTPKPPDKWYDENFLPSYRGDRPGRFGGPQQVKAKAELLAKEGIQPVENVELGGRYPDGISPRKNPAGGRDYYEVGTMNENGLPQARERTKLADEIPALGPNDTVTFVDKNNIGRRITYRPGDNVGKTVPKTN